MTLQAGTRPITGPIARSAFSLIELLVVITIIAVVIAITVPALSGARDLARRSATEGTINSLVQASAQFQADEQRAPGYFSPEEMGDDENVTRGFSSMQNIMLELIGGPVESGGTDPNVLTVGPSSSAEVDVNPSLVNVGENSKGYYTPGAKDFKPIAGAESSNDDHKLLPEVLDAWGMPILAWVENDLGSTLNDSSVLTDFAQIKAGDAPDPARFYWAQNSAALSATVLGQRQVDQATDSLLGVTAADDRPQHLAALLGSPNSSVKADLAYNLILPRVGRGSVVFQSAGSDRVFVSRKDNGYGRVGGNFAFGRNFTPGGRVSTDPYPNGPIDIIDGFDDIVTASGN